MRTAFFRRAWSAVRRRRELLNAWQRLATGERADLARLALFIPAVALLLRLIGFQRTLRVIERFTPQPRSSASLDATERALVRALRRASRYAPYRGNCLSQSLALWGLLRGRGIDAQLYLGARVQDSSFSAHAWVETDGRVLNDTPDVRHRFAPFQRAAVPENSAIS